MSLRRKRDGTYEARYYRDGTKQSPYVRENFGHVEPDHARELYKQRLAEAASRRLRGTHLITFAQAAARYINVKKDRMSGKGFTRTKAIVDALLIPKFGDRRLSSITPAEIEAYMAGRVRAGKSKATANREWTVMGAILRYASRKLRAEVPALGKVDRYKLVNRGARTAFIEPAEWQAIVSAFYDDEAFENFTRDRRRLGTTRKETFLENLREELPKIEVLLYSGQRLGDVLSLECADVSLERGEVTWRPAKTGGKPIVIPMGPRMRQILEPRVKGRIGKVWGHGDSPAAQRRIQRALRIGCELAGTRAVTPHMLRKTFGSWLARDDVSLRTIQALMGHADPAITARHYAHLTPNSLMMAVKRVETIAMQVARPVAAATKQPQTLAKVRRRKATAKRNQPRRTQRVSARSHTIASDR